MMIRVVLLLPVLVGSVGDEAVFKAGEAAPLAALEVVDVGPVGVVRAGAVGAVAAVVGVVLGRVGVVRAGAVGAVAVVVGVVLSGVGVVRAGAVGALTVVVGEGFGGVRVGAVGALIGGTVAGMGAAVAGLLELDGRRRWAWYSFKLPRLVVQANTNNLRIDSGVENVGFAFKLHGFIHSLQYKE
jgi:hypothetical protein